MKPYYQDDADLSAAVAILDGWKTGEQVADHSTVYWKDGQWVYPFDLPPYATSADAVIPLLVAQGEFDIRHRPTEKPAFFVRGHRINWHAEAQTLPRAICLCLLSATVTRR